MLVYENGAEQPKQFDFDYPKDGFVSFVSEQYPKFDIKSFNIMHDNT